MGWMEILTLLCIVAMGPTYYKRAHMLALGLFHPTFFFTMPLPSHLSYGSYHMLTQYFAYTIVVLRWLVVL